MGFFIQIENQILNKLLAHKTTTSYTQITLCTQLYQIHDVLLNFMNCYSILI